MYVAARILSAEFMRQLNTGYLPPDENRCNGSYDSIGLSEEEVLTSDSHVASAR